LHANHRQTNIFMSWVDIGGCVVNNPKDKITKAKISLRVSIFDWANPARLRELLDYLQSHPGAIDEVALFTQISGSALPLAQIQEHARLLAEVLPQFKALGLTAGINHLATVGHYDENLDKSLNEPWQHMVDVSGAVSQGCYCGSDPRVQDYVRQVYIGLKPGQILSGSTTISAWNPTAGLSNIPASAMAAWLHFHGKPARYGRVRRCEQLSAAETWRSGWRCAGGGCSTTASTLPICWRLCARESIRSTPTLPWGS
jgi:hypothetical protein